VTIFRSKYAISTGRESGIMRNLYRAAARTELIFLMIFLLVLCFSGGCNNAGQNNVMPVSVSDSSGTTVPTQEGAALKGTVVVDNSLKPLNHATVSIGSMNTTTDSRGTYSFTGMAPGTQTIIVTCQDYSSYAEQVQLEEGQTTTQDIAMAITADDWLQENTLYDWQVEAVQADGTVIQGPVWNFTTEPSRGARSLVMTEEIGQDQAETVADTFLAAEGQGFSISSVEIINSAEGIPLAYAFILSPAGYIIVPASRAPVLPPVQAYSFTSSFSTHQAASLPLVNMLRGDIMMRLAALCEKAAIQESFLARNKVMWDTCLTGKIFSAGRARVVSGPLLATTWGQGAPYDGMCPKDPTTEKQCPTGCPATSFAQLLNYWKSPSSITFTAKDKYTTETRKIIIDPTEYDFTKLDYANQNDDLKKKLSFAAGILGRMDYTGDWSSAHNEVIAKALYGNCGYEKPAIIDVTGTLDTSPIVKEIKVKRPVILGIKVNVPGKKSDEHSIVCDGYNDATSTFHLNFGWDGVSDGWYTLPAGMPDNYNVVEDFVYNLMPKKKGSSSHGAARAKVPENPWPPHGATGLALDEVLLWDDCDNAVSYNCYLWKAGSGKPSAPTFTGLPYSLADRNFLSPGGEK
jgi:hypothetical protein